MISEKNRIKSELIYKSYWFLFFCDVRAIVRIYMNFHEANLAFRICAAPAQQCHFVPDFASCVSLLLVSVPENRFSGVQHRVDDDMDTLFGLVHPALSAPETVPPAAASNHSGSTSQHSSDDQNPSTVDLHVAGGTSSSDQDWGLDGVCQWSNMSRICWSRARTGGIGVAMPNHRYQDMHPMILRTD